MVGLRGHVKSWVVPKFDYRDASLALYLPLWYQYSDMTGSTIYSYDRNHLSCAVTGGVHGLQGWTADGDDQINVVNVLSLLAATTQGTFIVRAKMADATPAASGSLIGFGDANAVEFITLRWLTNGKMDAYVADAGVNKWQVNTDAVIAANDEMVTLGVVQDGVSPQLFVNGVAVAQTFTITTDKTSWFTNLTGLDTGGLGSFSLNGNATSNPLTGTEESVLIYTRAFSATEMMAHHLAIRR